MKNLSNRSESAPVSAIAAVETPAESLEATGEIAGVSRSGLKLKIALILAALFWLGLVAMTWVGTEDSADADEGKAASATTSDDDYNFNWLDPEKKIYVLQNRRYTKANRVLFSLMTGPGLSNPYRTTINLDPRVAYYFTEQWGLEGFFALSFNTPNATVQALAIATSNTLAVVHEIRSEGGALVHWAPWYAKINVFNKILYFDWYFTGGGGVVNWYPGGSGTSSTAGTISSAGLARPAFFVGTGQQFHLTENVTIRLDVTGAYFTAPIVGTTGDTAWYSNYNFGLGLGFRL